MQNNCESPLLSAQDGSERETGEYAADAGQEQQSAPQEQSAEQEQDIQREQGAQPEQSASRLSWQEIMADPEYKREYDAQVQSIIQKRLRGRAEAEERLERLGPVLSALGERFGGLEAADMEELAREILTGESRSARETRAQCAREHLAELLRQEAELKGSFPDFDLLAALEDPAFIKLTAPHTGLSLEDAYYALHRREIGEATARRSLEAASSTVRAGLSRPRELNGRQGATASAADPRQMSKEQREALKKRIYEAKAQGKKLPFGG